MKLSEEVKNKIIDIIDVQLKNSTYEGLTEKKRIELGQFYTPAKICIQMIEMYDTEDFSGKNILDPTCGSGNLLIAMLIAGADSDKLFGNEYDIDAVKLCRVRLNQACDILGKPHIRDWQIHQGNGLQTKCLTDFSEEYIGKRTSNGQILPHYNPEYIDDLEYAQSDKSWRWENNKAKERKDIATQAKLRTEQKQAVGNKLRAQAENYTETDLFSNCNL